MKNFPSPPTRPIRFKSRKSLVYGNNSGFAMVTALVIMTAVFIMAGSLATTRQMWGFFSTKQLDRSAIELPARVDSANWLMQNRYLLLSGKQIPFNVFLYNITAGIVTTTSNNPAQLQDLQYAAMNDVQPFPPVLPLYPDYDTNSFSLTLDYLYKSRPLEIMMTTPQGAYDPYFGITNFGYAFGVVFKREMKDTLREARQGRFDSNLTQLRAWSSIDSALLTDVGYRRFPLSAFTLFTGNTTVSTYAPIVGGLITPSTNSYSTFDYSVDQVGIGRVYVDGVANFASNTMTLGFPMVANKGYTNTTSLNLFFPNYLGGGSATVSALGSSYKKNRYFVYRGMLASSYDRPQRLIGMYQVTNFPYFSKTIQTIISEAYITPSDSVSVKLQLNTENTNNVVTMTSYALGFDGADPVQVQRAVSTNIWTVNHAASNVTLNIPDGYFDATNFVTAPTSILFSFVGTNSSPYRLRVNVPSVGRLSTDPSRQKLSIITSNSMVIETNGFNADYSGWGSMLVSPIIFAAGVSGSSMNVGGTVMTRGRGTDLKNRVILSETTGALISLNLKGSLIVFNASSPSTSTTSINLIPDPNYLSGVVTPPSVLTGLDFRVRQEEMRTYTMFANTNELSFSY